MGQLVSDVTTVLNNKKANKEAESDRQKILAQIANDEKAKANLVKKALATQRAKYGADGMSDKGITEEAVLKRLRGETEEPFEEKKKANLEKFSKIKNTKTNLLKTFLSRFDDLLG
ncbi:MAG: hypothetical protein LBJ18_02700 [Rickettsiales bacterium]|jgi:hypothetical protein|nr:hypothetical protein [Rickettsiales bacterium]